MAHIYPKSERTLDLYKEVGAQTRLCKDVLVRMVVGLGKVLKANELHKLTKAIDLLQEASSTAENRMYSDHPEIGHDYINVFYGTLGQDCGNPVDTEVRLKAEEFANSIIAH